MLYQMGLFPVTLGDPLTTPKHSICTILYLTGPNRPTSGLGCECNVGDMDIMWETGISDND